MQYLDIEKWYIVPPQCDITLIALSVNETVFRGADLPDDLAPGLTMGVRTLYDILVVSQWMPVT